MSSLQQPLSNVQLELLKAFSHQLKEEDLIELRKLLAQFFAQKAIAAADRTWEERGWNDEEVNQLLNTKLRKRK
ncbi:MAG: hypothetical protein H6562_20240 [Lewinellaceae bacterium]|nr:hypothetical protein [Lewinellaceae bacterium]